MAPNEEIKISDIYETTSNNKYLIPNCARNTKQIRFVHRTVLRFASQKNVWHQINLRADYLPLDPISSVARARAF